MPRFEIFELDNGPIVVFLGTWGSGGVLSYRGELGLRRMLRFVSRSVWEYHPPGSVTWDRFHQSVYKTGKAVSLNLDNLTIRSIPHPPVEQYDKHHAEVPWKDNFQSEIPMAEVPAALLEKLKARPPGEVNVYLILYADPYETVLGDGRLLYPKAAFLEEAKAKHYLRRFEGSPQRASASVPDFSQKYQLKQVTIRLDDSLKKVVADLNIEWPERYSVIDILRLLVPE